MLTLWGGSEPAAFSPLDLSPALWLKSDAGTFQTVDGAAASANDDPVGEWEDQSTNANHATQGTAGLRPLLKTNVVGALSMIQPDATDDVLGLTSAIAFTGPFTVYAAVTRANATNVIFLGHTTGAAVLLLLANQFYAIHDGGLFPNVAFTGSTGTILVRIRRDASDVIKLTATGMAETTVGAPTAGTYTFNTVLAHPSGPYYNGGTNKHGERLAKAADVVTDTPALDTAMVTYLQDKWGVTLP